MKRPILADLTGLSRRQFVWLTGIVTSGVVVPSVLTGCAIDPVTGERTLMLMSEEQEIEIDRAQSPHQFSADYGQIADPGLNRYLTSVGDTVAARSHRDHMPYSFHAVNANQVNAYTFPGGTMAVTRGILVEMDSEAELAALLGHEVGHVNARHSAERATKGMLAQMVVGATTSVAGEGTLGSIVAGVGSLSATALLARYSRENEREADRLGMDYAVAAGANPEGMVQLMALLRSLNDRKPGTMEVMFSSHPMSDERFANVQRQLQNQYANLSNRPMLRERYMDNVAGVRAQAGGIRALRDAEVALAQQDFAAAQSQVTAAQRAMPRDYAARVVGAKVSMAQERLADAIQQLETARELNPAEGQAMYLLGVNYLGSGQYESAVAQFDAYEGVLPGNPNTRFLVGYSYDQQGRQTPAAEAYQAYLRQVQQGEQAQYAYRRLLEWGLV